MEIVHKGGGWDERDRRLIVWYFEELLKQRYKEFIEVLEVMKLNNFTIILILFLMNNRLFNLTLSVESLFLIHGY